VLYVLFPNSCYSNFTYFDGTSWTFPNSIAFGAETSKATKTKKSLPVVQSPVTVTADTIIINGTQAYNILKQNGLKKYNDTDSIPACVDFNLWVGQKHYIIHNIENWDSNSYTPTSGIDNYKIGEYYRLIDSNYDWRQAKQILGITNFSDLDKIDVIFTGVAPCGSSLCLDKSYTVSVPLYNIQIDQGGNKSKGIYYQKIVSSVKSINNNGVARIKVDSNYEYPAFQWKYEVNCRQQYGENVPITLSRLIKPNIKETDIYLYDKVLDSYFYSDNFAMKISEGTGILNNGDNLLTVVVPSGTMPSFSSQVRSTLLPKLSPSYDYGVVNGSYVFSPDDIIEISTHNSHSTMSIESATCTIMVKSNSGKSKISMLIHLLPMAK